MSGYLCTAAFFFPLGSRRVAVPPQQLQSGQVSGHCPCHCFSGIFIFGSCHTGENKKLEVGGDSGQNSRFVRIYFFTP